MQSIEEEWWYSLFALSFVGEGGEQGKRRVINHFSPIWVGGTPTHPSSTSGSGAMVSRPRASENYLAFYYRPHFTAHRENSRERLRTTDGWWLHSGTTIHGVSLSGWVFRSHQICDLFRPQP